MKRWMVTLAAAACLAPRPCSAIIVDTLRGFDTEKLGWAGSVEGSLDVHGGNSEVASLGAGGRVQWQGPRHRVRLLGAVHRTRHGHEDIDESEMMHLRHNRRLTSKVASLAFVQWQRNPFQRLTSRVLVGAGLRVDLSRTSTSPFAVGLGPMLEVERVADAAQSETHERLSGFLALNHQLREGVRLEATAFGQPVWNHWNDVRATAQGALRVNLSGGLDLVVSGQWQYDARPPAGVDRSDWGLVTGLAYEL